MLRLDKFLADMGIGTRSEVKKYLKSNLVTINGKIVKDSSVKVNPDSDQVMFDGKPVKYQEFFYYMLNKPAGCVSATRDGLSETVIEFLKDEPTRDLFPVGRLDKDTEGLLLITNDGMLAHNLLSPKKHVDKTYFAFVDKTLSQEEETEFSKGLDIGDDTPTLPAEIKLIDLEKAEQYLRANQSEATANLAYDAAYSVVLKEGRYHQVKRMFEHFGSTVNYLKRISMGNLKLDKELSPGQYRALTEEEITSLKSNE